MKVFLKKMAVMAAAVTILFTFSACDFLNGKGNQDDGSTTTQTDSTGTSTTNTTNTSGTTTGDNNTTGGGTTTGGETTGGDTSTGGGTATGGDSGTSTGGDQTVTTVAAFEELEGLGIDIIFYSNNTWEYCYVSGTQSSIYMSGTYTGNPAQDGVIPVIVTKEAMMSSESDKPGELVDCEPPENFNMEINDGILVFQDAEEDAEEDEDEDEVSTPQYYIRKANELANYVILNNDGNSYNLLKYIFYDNSTVRFISDGTPVLLGTYTGNPCADGDITLIGKYRYYSDRGLEASNSTSVLSILNGCFSGSGTIPAAREVAVIKGEMTEGINNFVRFYANGTFLITGIVDIVGVEMEFPGYYGTYTGNPCSTEANTQVVITITHINSAGFSNISDNNEESSGLCTWVAYEEEGNSITFTMNNNNQFISGDSIFIRQ